MKKHTAPRLSGHHNEYRKEVGSESWPWCIGQSHNRTIDKLVNLIVFVVWHNEVVALDNDVNPQAFKSFGNESEVFNRHVFNTNAFANHGSHTDKRANFNHVGQHTMCGTVQCFNPFDGKQVATNSIDACAHGVKQSAKLLNIRFASRVIDGGLTFSQHGRHDNVSRSGNRSFV